MKTQINNDSILAQLTAEQEKTQRLLNELRRVKSTDAIEITRLKKELATVRAVIRSYVMEIDSLNKVNANLTQENTRVKGQYEAAKMLKLSPFQTIRYIILPQVVKIVLPSIFNEIINLVKDSSLVYVLGVGDLLLESRTAANRDATLAPMFVAGAIYLILVGVVTVASKHIEKKFNYYK